MGLMIAADTTYLAAGLDQDDALDSFVIERRAGARVKIARPIKVIELGTGRHFAGRSRDVSAAGMRLEIPVSNSVREGDTIQVDVGSLSGIGPLAYRPRIIPARIVWVRREQKLLRPLLTAGVEFAVDHDAMINVA
jgi:PilZ domain